MNNENNWPCFNNSVTNILNFQSNATVAIKAIETVLCVDEDLKNEWNDFSYLEKLLDMVIIIIDNSSYHVFNIVTHKITYFYRPITHLVLITP